MFKNVSIYKKLVAVSIIMGIIPLIVGITGFFGLKGITSILDASVKESLPAVESLKNIQSALLSIRIAQRTYLNPDLNEEEFRRQEKNIGAAREKYNKAMDVYDALPRPESQDALWQNFRTAIDEWKKENNVFFSMAKEYGNMQEKYFKSKTATKMAFRNASGLASITSLEILYHFKSQVQEWKNILIRGEDQAKYDKYFSAFEKQETLVKEKLEFLKSLLVDIGENSSEADAAIHELSELGARYREGLKHFDRSLANPGKAVDTAVTGADRPLTEALDKIYNATIKNDEKIDDLRNRMSGYAMKNCRDREIVATDILNRLIEEEMAEAESLKKTAGTTSGTVKGIIILFSVGATIFALSAGISVALSITKPLDSFVNAVSGIARGDMTHKIVMDNRDELGTLASSINSMVENLGIIIGNLKNNTRMLSDSSGQLSGISANMEKGASEAYEMVSSVSASATQMSANASDIATSMHEASVNLSTVAVAAEEMTSTISEIAKNSEKARISSEKAFREAKNISTVVEDLGESAKNIGEVTDTIARISNQTNLLALNATIEAARAGEAGKGFAVVAMEIKDLANQTGTAVSDIGEKIANIQNTVLGAVSGISGIAGTIEDVNSIVSTIAAAIEEQSSALSEVAMNAAKISTGVEGVNSRISGMASASGEVAGEMSRLHHVAAVISEGSGTLKQKSTALSDLSGNLEKITSSFKV